MIKTTLGNLVNADTALQKILDSIPRISVKSGYHISKLITLIQHETKHYFDMHNKYVKEYGEEVKTTGQYRVKPENLEEFNKKLEELNDTSVEINWDPLNLNSLKEDADYSGLPILIRAGLVVLDKAQESVK